MRRRRERETDPGYQKFLAVLAESVREAREAHGLSQEALAEKAGVDMQTVQRLEACSSGRRRRPSTSSRRPFASSRRSYFAPARRPGARGRTAR
ncbi:MAG: helix-turn-helix transcriptional regulator [Nannocystaceae bacterium]